MKTRQILLASAAVAGLSLVNAAAASANQWYVSVAGGANWADDSSFSVATVPSSSTTYAFANDVATGFVFTGAVGMNLDQYLKGLRGEVELGYRENNVRGAWTTFTTSSGTYSGVADYQHSTFSVMANVWYDFQVAGLNPYIGGGIGWANGELDGRFTHSTSTTHSLSAEESGFAFQLGAGLTMDIQPGLKANIGYRYFEGPDISLGAPHPSDNPLAGDIENQNHSVTVGLNVAL